MFGFLIDNIFAMFGGSCETTESQHFYICKLRSLTFRLVPLFAPGRLHTGTSQEQKKIAWSFNFMLCYIEDVLLLNNSRIGDFGVSIYIVELEIKYTTDAARCASDLDWYLKIDSDCRLRTKLYNKQMISIFLLWTFHLYLGTFQRHMYME